MDLARYEQAYTLIRRATSGDLGLGDLETQLSDLIWDVLPAEDPNSTQLAGPALLLLAEWDRGHRSTDSVIQELRNLTRNQTLHVPTQRAALTASSARVYTETLTWRQRTRVVFGPSRGAELGSAVGSRA